MSEVNYLSVELILLNLKFSYLNSFYNVNKMQLSVLDFDYSSLLTLSAKGYWRPSHRVRPHALTPESKNLSMLTMFLRKPHSAWEPDSALTQFSTAQSSFCLCWVLSCTASVSCTEARATRAITSFLNILINLYYNLDVKSTLKINELC